MSGARQLRFAVLGALAIFCLPAAETIGADEAAINARIAEFDSNQEAIVSGQDADKKYSVIVSLKSRSGVPAISNHTPLRRRAVLEDRASDTLLSLLQSLEKIDPALKPKSCPLFQFVAVEVSIANLKKLLGNDELQVIQNRQMKLGLSIKDKEPSNTIAPIDPTPNLEAVHAPQVWKDLNVTGRQVVVGVLDGPNPSEFANAAADHALFISSIIAEPNRVLGMAPDALIEHIQIVNPDGSGSMSALLHGMQDALLKGVDVIHVSVANPMVKDLKGAGFEIGEFTDAKLWREAVNWAAELGTPVVVPAGDRDEAQKEGASVLTQTKMVIVAMGVASDYKNPTLASFSPNNDLLGRFKNVVLAPATDITGLRSPQQAGGDYGTTVRSGTAIAAAHIAGALALIKSAPGGATLVVRRDDGSAAEIRGLFDCLQPEGAKLLNSLTAVNCVIKETGPILKRKVVDVRQNDPAATLERFKRYNASWELFFQRHGYGVMKD